MLGRCKRDLFLQIQSHKFSVLALQAVGSVWSHRNVKSSGPMLGVRAWSTCSTT